MLGEGGGAGSKPADGGGGEAVRFKVLPTQILELAGLMLTLGLAFTVTLAVALAVQVPVLVAVTVKVKPPALLLLNVAVAALLLNVPPGFDQA